MAAKKTHLRSETDADRAACGRTIGDSPATDDPEEATCGLCLRAGTKQAEPVTEPDPVDEPDRPEAVTVAPETDGTLEGDDLIARKRLAGAGRSQEAGTAFGSRWTQEERDELQRLFDETGWNRSEAAKAFAKAHPHRTVQSALYQIDRNLTKPTK